MSLSEETQETCLVFIAVKILLTEIHFYFSQCRNKAVLARKQVVHPNK